MNGAHSLRKQRLPWPDIEKDFRSDLDKDQLNISALARKYKCTRQTILNRAKRHAWRSPNQEIIQAVTGADHKDIIIGQENAETVGILLDSISRGGNYKTACAVAGVGYQAFLRWKKNDVQFAEMVEKCEGESALLNLDRINKAAEGDWRAADRLLQVNKMSKEDFSQDKTPGSGAVNITINVPKPGSEDQNWGETIEIVAEDMSDEV
jgi:hypothetical protein